PGVGQHSGPSASPDGLAAQHQSLTRRAGHSGRFPAQAGPWCPCGASRQGPPAGDADSRGRLDDLGAATARASRRQEFDMTAEMSDRLARLRQQLSARGLQGFIVPRADEHLGEYVPASAERLAWLTGFTGSAGLAAVLPAKAAAFI